MTKPYPYQRRGVRKIVEEFDGRALLADSMGLGKTLQALLVMKKLLKRRDTVVVVCPATLKWNWQREAVTHVGARAEILETTRPQNMVGELKLHGRLLIVNYEILQHWLPYLHGLNPQMVVIDEVQRIKNKDSKCTKATKELCLDVPYVLGLGGTGGLENKPIELFPILNIIRPDKFPSYWRFGHKFCGPVLTHWGWKFEGCSNAGRLHRLLKRTCMVRRRKEDVLKDLPAKISTIIPVDIEDKKEYVEAERDLINWLRKTAPHKAERARRAERMVRMGYLLRLVGHLKLKAVRKWIDDLVFGTDEKCIVFGVHRAVVRGLGLEYCDKSVVVDGGVSNRSRKGRVSLRQQAIDHFLHDPKCRLLFGNIRAAGVGWSAKGVSQVLFTEFGWKPADLAQAADRAHGIGRGKIGVPTSVTYLVGRGTVEEKVLEIIQRKQKVLDRVLDGVEDSGELNLYDDLEEVVLKTKVRKK